MYVQLAQTSGLTEKEAYLLVLTKDDIVLFEGYLELQILAGLLHIHGYTLTPSHTPLPLSSPLHSSPLPLTPLDPHSVHDKRLRCHVQCLCKPAVKFVGSESNPRGGSSGTSSTVTLNLDQADIGWLNTLSGVAVACVCVLSNLDSPVMAGLQAIPRHGLRKPSRGRSTVTVPTTTFKLVNSYGSDSRRLSVSSHLYVPAAHEKMLNDITDYRGAVVLVCGDVNTGKSTFCRFLINSFLNRCEKVGYLECDVGQTEFTVAGVTALHVLTGPVFGSAYVDPRKPYKAYYFGHFEPAEKPHYYVCLIRQLHSIFMSDIHGNREVPLVINTCGWTTDLGVPLLMDIIRLTSPSHIVRLVPDSPYRTLHPLTDLLPFTPHILTTTPGLLTLPSHLPHAVEEEWYLACLQAPHIEKPVVNQAPSRPAATTLSHTVTTLNQTVITPSHTVTTPNHSVTTPNQTETTPNHTETTPNHTDGTTSHRGTTQSADCDDDDDSSSEDGMEVIYIDSEESCEPESDVEIIGYQPPPSHITILSSHTPSPPPNKDVEEEGRREGEGVSCKRRKRSSDVSSSSKSKDKPSPRKRATDSQVAKKRRRVRGVEKIPHSDKQRVDWTAQTLNLTASSEHWLKVEQCMIGKLLKVLDYNVGVLKAVAGRRRRKESSLIRRMAMAAHFSPLISGCGDHTHFLDTAPVLQVPWSAIALHTLHKHVPHSDMMHAMRERYVALCHVDPSEVIERQIESGGKVRFLRSHTPILEFLAMGIFRGSAPDKELYYVTTPLMLEDPVAMDTVNVLVMGESDILFGFPKATPTTFQHITIGQFAWKRRY